PCFPLPPPATTTFLPMKSSTSRGPPGRRGHTCPRETGEEGGGDRRRRSPATTTKGRPCEERPAYPCQMRALPTDGRDQEEGQNARLADARHARRTDRIAPARTRAGHLITTSRCPNSTRPAPSLAGGRERLVGLGRLERPTSRLSGVRSNQLSYRPEHGTDRSRASPREGTLRTGRKGCWRRDVQTAAGIMTPDSQSRLSS